MQFFLVFEFFPAPGSLGPPPRFDNKLLHSFWSLSNGDQFFSSSFSNVWIKLKIFPNFRKIFSSVCIFMSQWNYFRLDTGILDNLLRQWNGFWDTLILTFRKMLKFAIVLKIFQYLSFSESSDRYWGQRNFLSLGDGLLDWTFETKNGFELFVQRSWKLLSLILLFSVLLFFTCLLTWPEN